MRVLKISKAKCSWPTPDRVPGLFNLMTDELALLVVSFSLRDSAVFLVSVI